jgi:ZIP family zinc transporter
MTPLVAGVLGSTAAGMMTALGAVPVLLGRGVSPKTQDLLLGFAAGVMLAASFFSLIIPSLEVSERLFGAGWPPALIAVIGILMGGGGNPCNGPPDPAPPFRFRKGRAFE